MNLCPERIAKYLLCCSNIRLPINKSHYVTGKDLSLFSNLMCIENTLSSFTCGCKNKFNKFRDFK